LLIECEQTPTFFSVCNVEPSFTSFDGWHFLEILTSIKFI